MDNIQQELGQDLLKPTLGFGISLAAKMFVSMMGTGILASYITVGNVGYLGALLLGVIVVIISIPALFIYSKILLNLIYGTASSEKLDVLSFYLKRTLGIEDKSWAIDALFNLSVPGVMYRTTPMWVAVLVSLFNLFGAVGAALMYTVTMNKWIGNIVDTMFEKEADSQLDDEEEKKRLAKIRTKKRLVQRLVGLVYLLLQVSLYIFTPDPMKFLGNFSFLGYVPIGFFLISMLYMYLTVIKFPPKGSSQVERGPTEYEDDRLTKARFSGRRALDSTISLCFALGFQQVLPGLIRSEMVSMSPDGTSYTPVYSQDGLGPLYYGSGVLALIFGTSFYLVIGIMSYVVLRRNSEMKILLDMLGISRAGKILKMENRPILRYISNNFDSVLKIIMIFMLYFSGHYQVMSGVESLGAVIVMCSESLGSSSSIIGFLLKSWHRVAAPFFFVSMWGIAWFCPRLEFELLMKIIGSIAVSFISYCMGPTAYLFGDSTSDEGEKDVLLQFFGVASIVCGVAIFAAAMVDIFKSKPKKPVSARNKDMMEMEEMMPGNIPRRRNSIGE